MTKSKDRIDAERYSARVEADILSLTDEEILAAAAEDYADVNKEASRIRNVLIDAADAHGKRRLKAAQVHLGQETAKVSSGNVVVLSFADKRAKLARLVEQNPTMTMAARQGETLNEEEIDSILSDLADLGIVDSTEKKDK